MRPYAFLVPVLFALAARAATIPDNTLVAQERFHKLREGFITQISTLNGTIQTFLNGNRTNDVNPAEEQTRANFQIIESRLNTIKNDFTRVVNTLADGIESVRAANENPEGNNPSATTAAASGDLKQNIITNFANSVENGMATITTSFNNYVIQDQNAFTQGQQASTEDPVAVQPAEAQADGLPIPGLSGGSSSDLQKFIELLEAIQKLNNFFDKYIEKPLESLHIITTTTKRSILQNNLISQGLAAIQSLDPEEPGKHEKVKALPDVMLSEDAKNGHSRGSGDKNNSNNSGVEGTEPVNEKQKETLPEERAQTQKTEDVISKTE